MHAWEESAHIVLGFEIGPSIAKVLHHRQVAIIGGPDQGGRLILSATDTHIKHNTQKQWMHAYDFLYVCI